MGAGASIDGEDELKAEYEKTKDTLNEEQRTQIEAKFAEIKASKKGGSEFYVIGKMRKEWNDMVPSAPAEAPAAAAEEAAPAAAAEPAPLEAFPSVPEGFESGAKAGAPILSYPMTELNKAIDEALEKNLTPLILDYSKNNLVQTFYSYNATLIDAKAMFLKTRNGSATVPDVLNDARKSFVSTLKTGKTCVVAMQSAATDFVGKFNDSKCDELDTSDGKVYFPLDIFENSGRKYTAQEEFNKINRPGEDDIPGMENHFITEQQTADWKMIVLSHFLYEDFEDFLFPDEEHGLPQGKFQPIWIQHVDGTESNA